MEIKIVMPYIGSDLSVNHFKYGYYTKKTTKDWMEALGWQIKTHHIEDWKLPITVRCDGVFKDKRSCPDLSNLAKICLDAIEGACGVNDRYYRWQDGTITINKTQEPHLILTITEGCNG